MTADAYGRTHQNITFPTKHTRNASKKQPGQIPSRKQIDDVTYYTAEGATYRKILVNFPMNNIYVIILEYIFIVLFLEGKCYVLCAFVCENGCRFGPLPTSVSTATIAK